MKNKMDLIRKANQLKNKKLIGMIITNLLLIGTGMYISLIYMREQYHFITTTIGFALIMLALFIYVVSSNQFLPILFRMNSTQDNTKNLNDLVTIKTKQQFLQSKVMNFYFVFLSVGVCLSMIESVSKLTPLWATFAYVITLTWLAFNWFYVRPKSITKQQNSLDAIISNIEMVNQ